jgi:hypothetical protein
LLQDSFRGTDFESKLDGIFATVKSPIIVSKLKQFLSHLSSYISVYVAGKGKGKINQPVSAIQVGSGLNLIDNDSDNVLIYDNVEQMYKAMITMVAALQAGDTNHCMINEISQMNDILLNEGRINQQFHKKIFNLLLTK